MNWWKYATGGVLAFLILGTLTTGIALTMPGAFPVVLLAVFWWFGEPMTWESEFAYTTQLLLKGK